jgi:hypothetical protein
MQENPHLVKFIESQVSKFPSNMHTPIFEVVIGTLTVLEHQALADTRDEVSADRLYGFERFNLQNTPQREGVRRRGSTDYLCGLEEEHRRDRDSEGIGGLQVDHQLERRGLFHRQVAWLRPLENLIHIAGRATE